MVIACDCDVSSGFGLRLFLLLWFLASVACLTWTARGAPAVSSGADASAAALRWVALTLGGTVRGDVFSGRVSGRAARVALVRHWLGRSSFDLALHGGPRVGWALRDLDSPDALARLGEGAGLIRAVGVREIRCDDGVVRLRLPGLSVGLGSVAEGERLVRLLERLAALAPLADELVAVTKRASELQCPFCHDAISGGEATADCPRCGSVHHAECREEHGGCAVFACEQGRRARPVPA